MSLNRKADVEREAQLVAKTLLWAPVTVRHLTPEEAESIYRVAEAALTDEEEKTS